MKHNTLPVIGGIFLIIVGVLALLQTLGLLLALATIVWTLLFAVAGLGFLYVFLAERERWWAVIPGLVLLSIATVIALETWLPRIGDVVSGPLVVLAIALSFWIVYAMDRKNWWAIIPGGVMLSVAALIFVDELTDIDSAFILFFGMAATFLLVSFVEVEGRPLRWALIPAGVLALIGLFLAGQAASALAFVIPGILVLIGLYLVIRSLRAETAKE